MKFAVLSTTNNVPYPLDAIKLSLITKDSLKQRIKTVAQEFLFKESDSRLSVSNVTGKNKGYLTFLMKN